MAIYQDLSDSELLALLKASDSHAFTEIYNRYYYLIFVHAYKKTKDEELAKDVLQELFSSLWVKRETFTVTNLTAYLITCTKNKVINIFAHSLIETKYIQSLSDYSNSNQTANTDHLIRENQLKAYIEKEINALPKKMRKIFEMSRNQHLSNREIATKLDTSESNVSQHLANATKILRTKLGSIFFLTL